MTDHIDQPSDAQLPHLESAARRRVDPPLPEAPRRGTRHLWASTANTAALAVSCLIGVLGVFWSFVRTRHGQLLDGFTIHGSALSASWVFDGANGLLKYIAVPTLVVALVVVVGLALLRKQWALAVEIVIFLGVTNLTTQVLKYVVFQRPHFDLGSWEWPWNTLPSGHTTAAASTAIAVLLVAPRVMRAGVGVLAAVASTAFGFGTLAAQWHRTSDIIAAELVVLGWAFVLVTWQRFRQRRVAAVEVPIGVAATSWGLGTVGALALAGAAGCLVRVWHAGLIPDSPATVAQRHVLWTAYLGGGLGIVGTAFLGTAVLLRCLAHSPLAGS